MSNSTKLTTTKHYPTYCGCCKDKGPYEELVDHVSGTKVRFEWNKFDGRGLELREPYIEMSILSPSGVSSYGVDADMICKVVQEMRKNAKRESNVPATGQDLRPNKEEVRQG